MGKVIIFIIILSSSALTVGAFANGTCTYETEQVVKNGQVVKTTEVKKPATRKKQGYNAKLDESLGMRKGAASSKKQSMKSRRDESKGMAKKVGKKKAYGAVKTMDKKY